MKFLSFPLLVLVTAFLIPSFGNEIVDNVILQNILFSGGLQRGPIDGFLQIIIAKVRNDLKKLKNETNAMCVDQFDAVFEGLSKEELWAFPLIDAWGKIPSGMLEGHTIEIGSYDECVAFQHVFDKENITMRGQYCLPIINMDVTASYAPQGLGMRVMPESGSGSFAPRIGICTPDACTPEMLQKILPSLLSINETNLVMNDLSCAVDKEIEFTGIDIFAIVFFAVIGGVVLLSTIYDYVTVALGRDQKPLLITFSIITNGRSLFKIRSQSSPDVLECLNGIRCLSIIWVIFGHSYTVYASSPLVNGAYFLQWIKNYYSMLLLSATVSVDSFLLLSGLLVTWIVLKELDKSQGRLNVFMMYFHRYIRLTPVVAVTMLFSVSLFKFLGSGPFWKSSLEVATTLCEENWWVTLLYVQNYVFNDRICLGHTWYLAVDTQLYIISPLLLIPLWKWRKRFIPVIVILTLLSISLTIGLFALYDLKGALFGLDPDQSTKRMQYTYYPTHARAGAWLIGVLLGFVLHTYRGRRVKLSKVLIAIGWTISLCSIAAIIWGPYDLNQLDVQHTMIESALYEAFSRVGWAIALAWIIFACTQGYGGPINDFLSFPIWQPFGRLTYTLYITHLLVTLISISTLRTTKYLSDYEVICKFWADFGISMIVSAVVALTFESPVIGLEKILFRKSKTKDVLPGTSKQNLVDMDDEKNGEVRNTASS